MRKPWYIAEKTFLVIKLDSPSSERMRVLEPHLGTCHLVVKSCRNMCLTSQSLYEGFFRVTLTRGGYIGLYPKQSQIFKNAFKRNEFRASAGLPLAVPEYHPVTVRNTRRGHNNYCSVTKNGCVQLRLIRDGFHVFSF
jgi:hypothetical protein